MEKWRLQLSVGRRLTVKVILLLLVICYEAIDWLFNQLDRQEVDHLTVLALQLVSAPSARPQLWQLLSKKHHVNRVHYK